MRLSPGMKRKVGWSLLAAGSALSLFVSVLPILEMPFAGRISVLDLAAGAFSGGGFTTSRVALIAGLSTLAVSFVGSVLMLLRPNRNAA